MISVRYTSYLDKYPFLNFTLSLWDAGSKVYNEIYSRISDIDRCSIASADIFCSRLWVTRSLKVYSRIDHNDGTLKCLLKGGV